MSKGIIRTMDDLGRIQIPKDYRKRVGLECGCEVELVLTNANELTIKPFIEINDRFEKCIQELIDIAKASQTPSSILQITANTFARYAELQRVQEEGGKTDGESRTDQHTP